LSAYAPIRAPTLEKHGIPFEDAKREFDGVVVSFADERFKYGEDRIATTGMLDGLIVNVVIHTPRLDRQQITSTVRGKRREREALATRQR
jgi:uncharacterized protein